MGAVLDTHAVLWYLLDAKRLPARVFAMIDGAAASGTRTYVSVISLIEVVYLVERGRVPADGFERLVAALEKDQPAFGVAALDSNIAKALRSVPRNLVPDMPDRIIAATAIHLGLPLVTRDRRLQSCGIETIW